MLPLKIGANLLQQVAVGIHFAGRGYCVHFNVVAIALASDRVTAITIIPKATSSIKFSGGSLPARRLLKRREARMRKELVVFTFTLLLSLMKRRFCCSELDNYFDYRARS